MRKYRIKEVTNALGEKVYIPQYKDFLFWNQWYIYKSHGMHTKVTLIQKDDLTSAMAEIEFDRRMRKKKTTVSKEYIYPDT